MANELMDPRRMLRDIGEFHAAEIEYSFEHEQDPEGRPWPENAASTLRTKYGPSILTESARLRQSAKRFVVQGRRVILGPERNILYAAAQQKGTAPGKPIGSGRKTIIPARVFVGGTQEQATTDATIILARLRGLGDTK